MGILDNTVGSAVNALTGGAMNHVMGMIFGGAEDQRQYNQQQKLQGLQLQGAEHMADVSQQEQMKTWNETNYEAQVAHLENAGLNPALLYGKGGMGGSLGGGAVPMPTGAQASDAAARTAANSTMALTMAQTGLINAQTKAAESQANLNNTQATKIGGPDTQKTIVETDSLTQGIQNQKAIQKLTEVQTDLQEIQKEIQGKTIEEQVMQIVKTSQIAESQARSAYYQADVDSATAQNKIDLIRQQLTNSLLDAGQIKATTDKTQAEATVEQYKAALAKAGIAPDSPWYVKIIGSIANKLGLNPMQ